MNLNLKKLQNVILSILCFLNANGNFSKLVFLYEYHFPDFNSGEVH